MMLIFDQLFQKVERQGNIPNSFCKTNIILIPKLSKDTTKRKLYINIPENICAKILNKVLSNQIQNHI
jgi:hypothetical protein